MDMALPPRTKVVHGRSSCRSPVLGIAPAIGDQVGAAAGAGGQTDESARIDKPSDSPTVPRRQRPQMGSLADGKTSTLVAFGCIRLTTHAQLSGRLSRTL